MSKYQQQYTKEEVSAWTAEQRVELGAPLCGDGKLHLCKFCCSTVQIKDISHHLAKHNVPEGYDQCYICSATTGETGSTVTVASHYLGNSHRKVFDGETDTGKLNNWICETCGLTGSETQVQSHESTNVSHEITPVRHVYTEEVLQAAKLVAANYILNGASRFNQTNRKNNSGVKATPRSNVEDVRKFRDFVALTASKSTVTHTINAIDVIFVKSAAPLCINHAIDEVGTPAGVIIEHRGIRRTKLGNCKLCDRLFTTGLARGNPNPQMVYDFYAAPIPEKESDTIVSPTLDEELSKMSLEED